MYSTQNEVDKNSPVFGTSVKKSQDGDRTPDQAKGEGEALRV
jgi:hypothetical protein